MYRPSCGVKGQLPTAPISRVYVIEKTQWWLIWGGFLKWGIPKMGQSYKNGGFGGTSILGNLHILSSVMANFELEHGTSKKMMAPVWSVQVCKGRIIMCGSCLGCFWPWELGGADVEAGPCIFFQQVWVMFRAWKFHALVFHHVF